MLMTENNTKLNIDLQHGDCLELMKNIPDKSVDMVLCDLPYGTTDCKWDKRIPLEPLFQEYRRILKMGGVLALFGSEPFSTQLRTVGKDLYKYDWVWIKNCPTGFQHAKNMPLKTHEIISIFSTGSMGHKSLLGNKRMTYNPQGLIDCYVECDGKRGFKGIVGKRPSHKDKVIQTKTGYPKSVLYFDNMCKHLNNNNRLHPTQKPVDLLEYLIKTYTNPGETVLDNTMGSGSTGVACVNTGRNFIGIELDDHYYKVAVDRIEKAAEEKQLDDLHDITILTGEK